MNADAVSGATESIDPAGQTVLDPFEVRVLAVLAEKESLTPDHYPLSVNALTGGCNQLSSRDPVMSITEEAVQDVLHRLIQKKLVTEISQAGARVPKYEHRMRIKWSLQQDKLAVLTVLMLRGMQTAAEIRARVVRIHEFASAADIEAGLQFLIDKFPPLAVRLARSPGAKEARYAHLLSAEGIPIPQEIAAGLPSNRMAEPLLQDRITHLEQEVSRLRSEVASLSLQFDAFKKQFD